VKYITRIAIALSVLISGLALVPFMGLPTQGFNWQRYAGVYNPATLQVNHETGAPGSYFTLFGGNFSPNTPVTVSVNGIVLGEVQSSDSGELMFLINSTGADLGFYAVEASGNESAATQIILQEGAPTWSPENEGVVFDLPAGIAAQLRFMPLIIK
jgi:hypothetical protein